MRFIRLIGLLLLLRCLHVYAQAPQQSDRVTGDVSRGPRVRLAGHVPAWATAAADAGVVVPATPLRLTFVLTRAADRQAAFEQLLADQQKPDLPSYHQWLTPQQAGDLYGPTQHDVDALTAWLTSQGFALVEVAPSRVFVTVEAPSAAVTAALGTPFHNFRLNGESRLATTAEPTIPGALAPIVATIAGLSATPILPQSQGQAVRLATATQAAQPGTDAAPLYTISGGLHFLTPNDFATIFDLKPVYSAGYTGTGQRVAIIGRSRVVASDVTEFEANVGLATNLPNVIIPTTGTDPGTPSNGDQGEALLDVDRVIGTAPSVQADLVVSASNASYDGIYIAAQYEVQTLRDPVMNISFGSCEVYAGASGVSLWDTLFAQAASEGISVFVSAGDSGAGFCNTQFATPQAYQFRSVNYICASSYATCAGGTELADTASPSTYWSATNSAGLSSALSYIPEGAWNDPNSTANGVTTYLAQGTGGGASIYIPKPSWQTGPGVPADGARDVPDVSFPASGHDGYFACYAGGGGNCANGYFEYFSGTSAAAPGLSAVTALLNQKAGGSQGNLNPLLYRLASTAGVFHDTTPASSGVATCDVNTPSLCNNSDPSPTSLTGGLAGFALTTGYDQATGNGSLDVFNFLTAATATTPVAKAATTLAITGSATSVTNGGSATFTATLSSSTAGTPTGTVQFYIDTVATGSPVTLSGGKASVPIVFTNAGVQLISAVYSGDGTYATSTAPAISFSVIGLAPQISFMASATTTPNNLPVTFSATITPTSGSVTPTGLVRFYDNYLGYFATVPLVNGTATTPPQIFVRVGTHFVSAYYLGDPVYQPVSRTSNTLAVTASIPTINWPTPAPITFGTALTSAQLDATASVAGTFAYTPAAGIVPAPGTQMLSVLFTPTDTTDYKTAAGSVTLVVNKAAPVITWATPAAITYGTPLSATQLNASASVAGSFVYTPAAGSVPGAGTQTLSSTFTPTDATDYSVVTTTVMLTVNKATPTVTWPAPAAIPYGTVLSGTQLDATASVPGSFAYTPAAGTVPSAGPQTLTATFTATDAADYATPAPVSTMLTVNKVPLTTLAGNGMRPFGAANPAFTGTLTGLVNADAITAVYATTAAAPSPVGVYPISATLADPANRLPNYTVTSTPGTLTITKATTITTLNVPANANAGAAVTLTAVVASTTSGTPSGSITFSFGAIVLGTAALDATGTGTLSIATLPSGSDSLSASYGSDGNFNGSSSAAVTIGITAPDYSVTASAAYASINAGQSASFPFLVTPVGGFSQAVTFSVTGLPASASATFMPASVAPAGAPVPTQLVVATDVQTAMRMPASPTDRWMGAVAFAVLLLPFLRRRRSWTRVLGAAAFCAMLLSAGGCGGPNSSSGVTSTSKTPDGSYTLTVTAASGSTSHTTTVALTIAN